MTRSSQFRQGTLNVPPRSGANSPNIRVQDVDADKQAVHQEPQAVGSPSGSEGSRLSPSGTKKSGTENTARSGDGISDIVRSATKTSDWCEARGVVIVQASDEESASAISTLMLPSRVALPDKKVEVARLKSMIDESQLDEIVAASVVLKPFCEQLKTTVQDALGEESQDRLDLDELYLRAILLAVSRQRCDTDPTSEGDDATIHGPKALARREGQALLAKLKESNSVPEFQPLPSPNEVTVRNPVDAFLETKIAVVERSQDKLWLEPRFHLPTYIWFEKQRDPKVDPDTIIPDAALSVRIYMDHLRYLEPYGTIMGMPKARDRFLKVYRYMMQILSANLKTADNGPVALWPVMDFHFLLIEYKKESVRYAYRQLAFQMATALFFNHSFQVDTDEWPVYGLLIEGVFVTVYVGWLVPGDKSSKDKPHVYIYQVCSNASTAAETLGGNPVQYSLLDANDIVTLDRHIDRIRAYGGEMKEKAGASVERWLQTLADPKTYDKAEPDEPFLWYHRQTMLDKKKVATPVTELPNELSKPEQKESAKPSKPRRTKPIKTDDQPYAPGGSKGKQKESAKPSKTDDQARAEGSRLTRSSTRTGGRGQS